MYFSCKETIQNQDDCVINLSLCARDFFFAILGRGPGAFLIGEISDIHPEFGKFSTHSNLMLFPI